MILDGKSTLKPEKIILLDHLLDLPPEHSDLLDEFVALLEKSTNAEVQRIGLAEIWNESPPKNAAGKSLADFLGQAIFRSFCYDYSHEYGDFREAYRQQYNSEPFAEATTQFRWYVNSVGGIP